MPNKPFLEGVVLPASVAAEAPLRIPHGTAPTSPVNGDVWTTTAGVFARINGTTVGPFGTGGAGFALDADVVHLAGTETITGIKTFAPADGVQSTVTLRSRAGVSYIPPGFDLLRQGAAGAATPNYSSMGLINFKGLSTGLTEFIGAAIESNVATVGASEAEGRLIFLTNDGTGLSTALGILQDKTADFAGTVQAPTVLVSSAPSYTEIYPANITVLEDTVGFVRMAGGGTAIEAWMNGGVQTDMTSYTNFNADVESNGIKLRRWRGTQASKSAVQSGDALGRIAFEGGAATPSTTGSFASIRAYADGTPGASDYPGRLSFWTVADGASAETERLRIDSAGVITSYGTIIAPAATTSLAPLRIPHGSAPTSPTNGDVWTTTAGLFARINGTTVGPFTAGGLSNPMTTLGDIIYGGAAGTPTRLAGDTSNANRFLRSVSSGGVAAAPTWAALAVADVSGAAPLAGPTFTGVPAAPTAAADTNTTQLATTAFVVGQAGTATPLVEGTAAVGTSLKYARQDHVHPSGGGGGSPGGSSGSIQFNNAGVLGGAANYDIENNLFRMDEVASPTAPAANGVALFARNRGGRMFPAWIGPSGLDTSIQPALFANRVTMFLPQTGTTGTGGNFGAAWTSNGTVTHPTPSSTAPAIANQMKRTRYANVATTTNQQLGPRFNAAAEQQFWRGNAAGLGGFFFSTRFIVELYPASTVRIFAGLTSTATGSVCISDTVLNNTCGLWHDTTDPSTGAGAFSFVTRDATTTTKQSITLANAIAAGNAYEFQMFCPPNGTTISWRLYDINNNVTYTNSTSTTLPQNTAFMQPQVQMSNGTANVTVTTVAIGICSIYVESDI